MIQSSSVKWHQWQRRYCLGHLWTPYTCLYWPALWWMGCSTNRFCIMTSTIHFDQSIKHRRVQKCNIPERASHPVHCCHPPGWSRAGGGRGCGPGRCARCGAGLTVPRWRNKSQRWQRADQQGRTSLCICKQEQSLCHYLQRGLHRAGSLLKLRK